MKKIIWFLFTVILAIIIFCTAIILIPMQTKNTEKIELTYIFVDENWDEYDIFEPIHWAATDRSFLFEEDNETETKDNNGVDKNTNIEMPNKDYLAEIEWSDEWTKIEWLNKIETWGNKIENNNSATQQEIVNAYENCTTPRNTTIKHWESVIAYQQRSDVPNICNAQKRTCENWELNWTYQQWACEEDIVYEYTRVKVISFNEKKVWELVQTPELAKNDWAEFDTNGKINPDGKQPTTIRNNNDSNWISSNAWVSIEEKVHYNCQSPRWDTVKHWQFIKAYKEELGFVDQKCEVELRLCLDWKLNGRYKHKSCEHQDITYQDHISENDDITVPSEELLEEIWSESKKDDVWWSIFDRITNLFK